MGLIYKITNKLNNKIYIGQTTETIERRFSRHVSHSKEFRNKNVILYKAFKKYGVSNFIIEMVENVENEILSERESYWIRVLNSLVPFGYNMLSSGNCMSGNNNPFYGRTHSEYTKNIMKEKASNRKGSLNPFYGKTHSEESKSKISESNIGRLHSEEFKTYMKEINTANKNPFYGKKHSEDFKTKQKMNKCLKNIKLDDLNGISKIFDTIFDAIKYLIDNELVLKTSKSSSIRARIKYYISSKSKGYGFYWEVC